ncbi:PhzF family phenazine biosynthesis isomerase [Nakamurella aerolata]|uniref:PhzF family phenazine biosynthesis protein n=1 Tax=Nakamurella aerolata TaxID=1656892 RepID=A0A849A1T2_9ACTN|nr:PhzF family phenazine biosynthesis protein [Nakamurella aerolata]
MPTFAFSQVDVFAPAPLTGNPVAVVHDAVGLTDEQLAAFARWTNLSETTFLLPPTEPGADYRLRIFTPGGELPFAGHPTLGSAHAFLEQGGRPTDPEMIVQQCQLGLIRLRRNGNHLAFAAPELLRSGPVDADTIAMAERALGIGPDQLVRANWIDNGPGWLGIQLTSADDVLALRPDFAAMGELNIGVIGAHQQGGPADFEVRAFCPDLAVPEDPVTGSLNAGFALWLIRSGAAPANYTVRQGTALRRHGQVEISSEADGTIWVGGASRTLISGTLTL